MDGTYKNMAEGNKIYLMKLMSVIYGKQKFKKESSNENNEEIDTIEVVNNNGLSATIRSLSNAMQVALNGTDFAPLIYSDENKNYYRYSNDNLDVHYDICNEQIEEEVYRTRVIKRIKDIVLSTEYYKCEDFMVISEFVQASKDGQVYLALNNTDIEEMNDEKIVEYMLEECENAKSIDFEDENQFPQEDFEKEEKNSISNESEELPRKVVVDKDGYIYYKEEPSKNNENILEKYELNLPTNSGEFNYKEYAMKNGIKIGTNENSNDEELSEEYADYIDDIIGDLLSISAGETVFSEENDAYKVVCENTEINDDEIKQARIEKAYETADALNDEIIDIIDFINDIEQCKYLSKKLAEKAKNIDNVQITGAEQVISNSVKDALNNSKRGMANEIYLDRIARIIKNKEKYSIARVEDGKIVTITSKTIYDEDGNSEEIIDGKDTVVLVQKGNNLVASLKNSNYSIIIASKDDGYMIKNKGLEVTKKIVNKKLAPDIYVRYISDKIGTETFTVLYLIKNVEQELIYLKRQDESDPQNLMDLTVINKKLSKGTYNDLLEYANNEMSGFYSLESDDIEIDDEYIAESVKGNVDSINSEKKARRRTAVALPDNDEDFVRFCNYEEQDNTPDIFENILGDDENKESKIYNEYDEDNNSDHLDEELDSSDETSQDTSEISQLNPENLQKIQEYLDENEVYIHGEEVEDYIEKQDLLADVDNLIECEDMNLINIVSDIDTIKNGYNEIEKELNNDCQDEEDSLNR